MSESPARTDLPTYSVRTTIEDRPVSGSDSCIAPIPGSLYDQVDDQPVLNLSRLGAFLRAASELSAQRIGERLHHASWVITDDPAVIEERGMHEPDCVACRQGVDQALGHLAEHRTPLLVGTLHWAG